MNNRMIVIVATVFLMPLLLVSCSTDQGVEKAVFVGPVKVECEGVGPQTCLLVAEDPSQDYQLFYDQIEGFEHQEGFEYELLVREEIVENPPADGSSIRWVLVEEVSKTPVAPGDTQLGEADQLAQPNSRVMTLYVGPVLVDCEGEGPQKCMLVKEHPEEEYGLFYDQIAGFTFEEGYEYELQVQVDPVANPPAGGSSLRYTLVEQVSKTPVAGPSTGTVEGSTGVKQLEGTLWRLVTYVNEQGATLPIVPGSDITITFENGNVNGQAGCNSYFGAYTAAGSQLQITVGGSTMMACAPELLEQETAYLAALSEVGSYVIVNDRLVMADKEGNPFLNYRADEPNSISGQEWLVTGYNNGKEAVVSVIIGTELTALFQDDGMLSGSAGCNTYNADYETDGAAITIGPAASTRMFCGEPKGIMEQEAAYLAALQTATTYTIEGDRLELRTGEGALAVSYSGAATGLPVTPPVVGEPAVEPPAAEPPAAETTDPDSESAVDSGQAPELISADPEIAQAVVVEVVEAVPYDASQPGGPVGAPEHVAVLFDGQPVMAVYPVADYISLWESAGDRTIANTVDYLVEILTERPSDLKAPLPILPAPDGLNDVAAQIAYLDFTNGSGLRFVGRTGQSINPVTNSDLNYYFQGLTSDGQFYVTFIFPVSTSELPDSVAGVTAAELQQVDLDFLGYLETVTSALNGLDGSDFSPDINDLDGVLQTLNFIR